MRQTWAETEPNQEATLAWLRQEPLVPRGRPVRGSVGQSDVRAEFRAARERRRKRAIRAAWIVVACELVLLAAVIGWIVGRVK